MATKIGRTGTSSTNATKFTWSAWVKRANIGSDGMLYYNYLDGNNRGYLQFLSNDKLYYYDKDGGDEQANLTTTAVYRDPNAFYHICLIGDSTDGTQGDRIQLYVNGVRQTMTGTYPDQNDSLGTKVHTGTNYHVLGTNSDSTSNPFLGIMSHVHYVDGIDYPATTFGSTDATTGEWKINASPSISTSDYGNNGYFVLKDGNSVTDQSGNSHNFTVTAGTLTKTEDNPSNIFCTMNPLMNYSNGTPLFNLGNNRIRGGGSAWLKSIGTLGNRTGKFYYEAKINTYYGDGRPVRIGWDSIDLPRTGTTTYYSGFNISSDGFIRGGVKGVDAYDPNATSLGGSFTGGDFLGFAIDLDNDLITCYKNGTVFSNVNGLDISGNTNCSIKNSRGHQVSPSCNWYATNDSDNIIDFNFGNGVFGDTQLTGTTYNDSQGNGIFKYQPPANYLCWSTKSFNV